MAGPGNRERRGPGQGAARVLDSRRSLPWSGDEIGAVSARFAVKWTPVEEQLLGFLTTEANAVIASIQVVASNHPRFAVGQNVVGNGRLDHPVVGGRREQRLSLRDLRHLRRRRETFQRGREHGAGFQWAAGRLIELGERERRAEGEAARAL
jgi:hypothetical protein